MYRGINIFPFYSNLNRTRWNNPNSDIKENCAVFKNEKVPPFLFYIETLDTQVEASIVNIEDESIEQSFTCTIVSDINSFKLIKFLSTTYIIPSIPDGYYYIKLKLKPSNTYFYSEIFALKTNPYINELLRVVIQSSNITLSGVHNVPFSEISAIEFFLFINGITLTGEINEDGIEKPYGNMPVFNTLNIKHSVEINCTNDILRYLHALRIFETNGAIYIAQGNLSDTLPEVYGIEISVKDEYNFGDHIIAELVYREKDYISTRNEI